MSLRIKKKEKETLILIEYMNKKNIQKCVSVQYSKTVDVEKNMHISLFKVTINIVGIGIHTRTISSHSYNINYMQGISARILNIIAKFGQCF